MKRCSLQALFAALLALLLLFVSPVPDGNGSWGPGGCYPAPPAGPVGPPRGYPGQQQGARESPNAGQVDASVLAASVEISVKTNDRNGGGFGGSGTCFYVVPAEGWGYVITCKHVAPGNNGYTVNIPGRGNAQITGYTVKFVHAQQPVAASWVAIDSVADLAILKIPANYVTPNVKVASHAPQKGEQLYQVGFPASMGGLRGGLTQRVGSCGGYRIKGNSSMGFDQMVLSFEVRSGDSGSGVFLASEKALCGVVWGKTMPGAAWESSACCWADIKRFTEQTCNLFPPRKQPNPPTAPTQPAPPSVVPPGVPPPPAMPPQLPDLQDIRSKIQDLENKIAGLLPSLNGSLTPLNDKIKALEDAIKGIPPSSVINGFQNDLAKLKQKLDALKSNPVLDDISQKLPIVIQSVESVANWLPVLGLATPATAGVGGLIWLLLRAFAAKKGVPLPQNPPISLPLPSIPTTQPVQTVSQPPTIQDILGPLQNRIAGLESAFVASMQQPSPSAVSAPVQTTAPQQPPLTAQPPPVANPQWVEVPDPSNPAKLYALQQALVKCAQDFPGSLGTIKNIQSIAAQIEGSLPKFAKGGA